MTGAHEPVVFNRPLYLEEERQAVCQVLSEGTLSSHGPFTQRCEQWLREYSGSPCALMTSSCTHALEMAAILIDVGPGDEVIMPSWTFVSTANAFVLRGATPVFVDIRGDTCNLDETLLEAAITPRTRAIVAVHYAGVGCDMDQIMAIARRHSLYVIEDAAHAVMSSIQGRPAGAIGHLGAFSFHATKNYTAGGQGGALLVNDPALVARASIVREKGTNRDAFVRGEVGRYQWHDVGSSYAPGELQAACLSVQLAAAEQVNRQRLTHWQRYFEALQAAAERGAIRLPTVPDGMSHNAHMFYLRADSASRQRHILECLNQDGVMAMTHYEPLHCSPAGERYGRVSGSLPQTRSVHDTLVRLPLFYALSEAEQVRVIDALLGCL